MAEIRDYPAKSQRAVEVRLDANRLILQGVADKLTALRRFRGIWKDEDVDKVFQEIDEEWGKWPVDGEIRFY